MTIGAHLNNHHRDTVERIFARPPSHNVEWRQVVSLLEAIGTVTEERNGKLKVELGPETEVLPAPHGKDVDTQVLVDLRRMLSQAGYAPPGSDPVEDERSRNYGDSRWGKPT
ncbi:MAG: type II toxin-antitoxin system HicA family toxin [Actinobacteria bacterium]|nr:type II toxin-antitoxin system HicA family toxin [Actinomycetota bacterium]